MEEALIKRVLPHSVEAEQSVIGSMLMDREAIMAASEIVTSEDFYQHQYGIVFEAMLELYNEGKPVDLITLQERLREKEVPPEVSSLEFIKDLLNTTLTSANVRSYAQIVQEKIHAAQTDKGQRGDSQHLLPGKGEGGGHHGGHRAKKFSIWSRSAAQGTMCPLRMWYSMPWKRSR